MEAYKILKHVDSGCFDLKQICGTWWNIVQGFVKEAALCCAK